MVQLTSMNSSSQLALGGNSACLRCNVSALEQKTLGRQKIGEAFGVMETSALKGHGKDARMYPNNHQKKQSECKKRLGTRYTAAPSPKCGFFSMVFQFNNSKVQPTDI